MRFYAAILIALTAALLVPASGQTAGQTGLAFLKLGAGARPIGMGEAYAALGGDGSAMYYNPATLSSAGHPQILLMHKEWIQDVRTEYLGALAPMGALTMGLSVNATSVSDIELRTVPGPPIETFSARNAAVGLSLAYALDQNLSLGATGKFLYEKILIDESSGFGFDLGLLYKTPWQLNLAATIQNLGSVSALQEEAPTLPRMLRIGGAYMVDAAGPDGRLTLSADLVSVTNESLTHLHMGAEYLFRNAFALRFGYQTGYEAKTISAGAGIRYGLFGLDYAFVPFRYDFGSTHTLSLAIDIQ